MSGTLPRIPSPLPWLFVISLWLVAGCAPKIGDHCTVSTDCSANGDRLCDTTQPGGYCTIFNCEPNGCPEESVCVAFNEKSCPDVSGGQATAQAVRFQRTFCMVTCQGDDNCRGGYSCLDTTNDPARKVVDTNPVTRKICTVPPASSLADAAPPPDVPPPAVCFPSDAAFPGADVSSDAGAESNMSSMDVSLETSAEAGAEAGFDAAGDAPDVSSETSPEGAPDSSPDGADAALPDGADELGPDGSDDADALGADGATD